MFNICKWYMYVDVINSVVFIQSTILVKWKTNKKTVEIIPKFSRKIVKAGKIDTQDIHNLQVVHVCGRYQFSCSELWSNQNKIFFYHFQYINELCIMFKIIVFLKRCSFGCMWGLAVYTHVESTCMLAQIVLFL
jgi:hypothetical protein